MLPDSASRVRLGPGRCPRPGPGLRVAWCSWSVPAPSAASPGVGAVRGVEAGRPLLAGRGLFGQRYPPRSAGQTPPAPIEPGGRDKLTACRGRELEGEGTGSGPGLSDEKYGWRV